MSSAATLEGRATSPLTSSITSGFTSFLEAPKGAVASVLPTSIYDGANFSTRRGYVYAPTSTEREISSASRTELLRKARWLTRNVGYAKRCVWGLARMAGWLSPIALTGDKDWNRDAMALFERRYGASPIGFDVMGRQNFYSYQPLAIASRLQDGDFFSAFTESQTGGAMVMSYEAHQVGNGMSAFENPNLLDGVRVDRLRRAAGFNILDADGNGTEFSARDIVQHADFMSVNHTRAVSALHHAITNLLDRTQIYSDTKLGITIASKQGLYIVNELPQQRQSGPPGMGGATGPLQRKTAAQWTIEEVFDPSKKGGKIVELQDGQDLRQLLDQRPHPNTREFLEDLNRDIAAGIDMPVETLWNLAKLGGASVRYVLGDAQKTIERLQQLLVDQFLTRFWVFFVSREMAAGRLRPCQDPNWYVVGWQPPAKLTVDIGRDGKLSIDLHKAGMLTLARWFGSQGLDWKPEVDQAVEEYAYKVLACQEASKRFGFEIKPADVWRDTMSTQNAEVIPDLNDVDVTKVDDPEQVAA